MPQPVILAGLTDAEAKLLAIITGVAAIISAVSGVLLAIRAARNKERVAARKELNTVTDMLDEERADRIQAEQHNYRLALLLTQNGIEVPSDLQTPVRHHEDTTIETRSRREQRRQRRQERHRESS